MQRLVKPLRQANRLRRRYRGFRFAHSVTTFVPKKWHPKHTLGCVSVKDLLAEKTRTVPRVSSFAQIKTASQVMQEHKSGAVMVHNKHDKEIGIFTARDVQQALAELDSNMLAVARVNDFMTPLEHLKAVEPQSSVDDAAQLMLEHNLRHIPVMKDGKSVAILSMADVVGIALNNQLHDHEVMEHFIAEEYSYCHT